MDSQVTNVTKAMEAVNDHEEAMDRHIRDVAAQPTEALTYSINGMTNLRDKDVRRRAELEAEHRVKMDQIKKVYSEEKEVINRGILELERQLGILRDRWTKTCDEEQSAYQEERNRWVAQDMAQRKLIDGKNLMIDFLKN
jgi:hypothetical protein